MKRFDFLKMLGGGTIVALAGSAISACKKTTTLDVQPNPQNGEFTSTITLNHTHQVIILRSDILAPGATGMTTKTSYPSGGYSSVHTHTFAMTQAQLMEVADHKILTIETGSFNAGDGPHTHWFTIDRWWW
jgi:hypothetical protein